MLCQKVLCWQCLWWDTQNAQVSDTMFSFDTLADIKGRWGLSRKVSAYEKDFTSLLLLFERWQQANFVGSVCTVMKHLAIFSATPSLVLKDVSITCNVSESSLCHTGAHLPNRANATWLFYLSLIDSLLWIDHWSMTAACGLDIALSQTA